MNFYVMTLFPEMIDQAMNTSIMKRAMENQYITLSTYNIRDYTEDKHKRVDDYTYGGGAGMLMQAQPVYDCFRAVMADITNYNPEAKVRVIYVTPQGSVFSQPLAASLSQETDLVFLCGHYEGIDERVLEEIVSDYISIGDYVLTGGELPALVMMDAIARLVPGVLGKEESFQTESFSEGLLEYPQYTRPEVWRGKKVPDILMSGHHANIEKWRLEQSIQRTKERRPDLYRGKFGTLAGTEKSDI
ncbi:MAG: tRNA (guanosine(37)-N1)-methyltransferase TrmD [Lachnospiraceae bacterium]